MEGDDSFTNIPGTRGNLKSLKQHYCEAVDRRPPRGRRRGAKFKRTDGQLTIESRARGSGACLGRLRVGAQTGDVGKGRTKKKQRVFGGRCRHPPPPAATFLILTRRDFRADGGAGLN